MAVAGGEGRGSCCRGQRQRLVSQDIYGGDVAGSGNAARHRNPTTSLVVGATNQSAHTKSFALSAPKLT